MCADLFDHQPAFERAVAGGCLPVALVGGTDEQDGEREEKDFFHILFLGSDTNL
jgi:hypothetical protein